jgi:hypothetical protein
LIVRSAALLGATVLVLFLLLSLLTQASWALAEDPQKHDLGAFIAAGRAHERGENPYEPKADAPPVFYFGSIAAWSVSTNPPISLYAFDLLADLEGSALRLLAQGGSLALYALVCVLLLGRYREKAHPLVVLWLAALAGLWYVVFYGQIYVLLLAAVSAGWLWLERDRPYLAGPCLGLLVAVKLWFGLWPLALLIAGYRKAALSSLATTVVLFLVPLLVDGTRIYGQWADGLATYGPDVRIPTNGSILALAARLDLPVVGWVASALIVVGVLAHCYRTRPSALETSALAIVAALVIGPASWTGYTLFALPVLLSRSWQRPEWAVALALAVPAWTASAWNNFGTLSFVLVGGLHGWPMLILLVLLGQDARRRWAAAGQPAAPTTLSMQTAA